MQRLGLPNTSDIKSGDELRNVNCYEYLLYIVTIARLIKELPYTECEPLLKLIKAYDENNNNYNPNTAYGDLYTDFILTFESYLEKYKLKDNIYGIPQTLDPVVEMIYENENMALERSEEKIDKIVDQRDKSFTEIEGEIKKALEETGNTINKTTPGAENKKLRAAVTMMGSHYKPLSSTSMPSVRKYKYSANATSREIRMGTQGQTQDNKPRVNPIFEAWILSQQRKRQKKPDPSRTIITHIYFNNLPRDRKGLVDIAGKKEASLTAQLEALDDKYENIAVITLPSDKGLMSLDLLSHHAKSTKYADAFTKYFNIAAGLSSEAVQDFFISDKVKKILYTNDSGEYVEEKILRDLLRNSFIKMGFNELSTLSDADMHAVYFHFMKFELTNYIIQKLNPDSFNMSCKDGIDRGGVSSAYYNLMKSIESGQPLNKDEFYRALHAAPALVKGRGMNHHIGNLWNAVNEYTHNTNNKNIPSWLNQWVRDNAPQSSRQYFIKCLSDYMNDLSPMEQKPKRFSSLRNTVSKIFESKVDVDIEMSTIIKLQHILSNDPASHFTPEEWRALQSGKLKALCKEMEDCGLTALKEYEPVPASKIATPESKKEIDTYGKADVDLIHKLIIDLNSLNEGILKNLPGKKARILKMTSDLDRILKNQTTAHYPIDHQSTPGDIKMMALEILQSEFKNEMLVLGIKMKDSSNKWRSEGWKEAESKLNQKMGELDNKDFQYPYQRILAAQINLLCVANKLDPKFPNLNDDDAEKKSYQPIGHH